MCVLIFEAGVRKLLLACIGYNLRVFIKWNRMYFSYLNDIYARADVKLDLFSVLPEANQEDGETLDVVLL